MKKLLITTLAAVSVGLCAKAETAAFAENGVSFEESGVPDAGQPLFQTMEVDGQEKYVVTSGSGWATGASTEDLFTVTNVSGVTYPSRPQMWDGKANTKALAIDTTVPLMRNADGSAGTAQEIATPIFFDSVVQFTATDAATAPAAEDKLVVWLYASEGVDADNPGIFGETEAITNLVVTARYKKEGVDAEGNPTEEYYPTNYLTNVSVEPETWHRLTIRAINDIDPTDAMVPGFEVWVDEEQAEGVLKYKDDSATAVKQFMSLHEAVSVGNNVLKGVAFDGKGAVDDLVFTATDPFAVPSYEVTVKLNDTSSMSYGPSKYYSTDGLAFIELDEFENDKNVVLTLPLDTEKIIFKVATYKGYKIEGGNSAGLADGEWGSYGYTYWTKEIAINDIVGDGMSGTVSLVVEIDEEGGDSAEYEVAADSSKEYTVTLQKTAYKSGETVNFTVKAEPNYEIVSVFVKGTNFSATPTGYNGNYAFTMPAEAVKITVTTKAIEEEVTYPSVGGESVKDAAEFIAAANSGVVIKVPTGWTLDGNTLKDADDNVYATFAEYYTVALAADGTVTLELNDTAKPTINETAADKGDAIVVTDEAVALGVTNAKTGLWYGAQAYSDAACTTKIGDEPTGWEKATGETVTVTATKPEGDMAFFKVVVTDIAPESTEE